MGGGRAAPPGELHGFAAPMTSFVGRETEVAEVAALLAEYRLVTVTGPGGMGKTRLAGEVARRVCGRFADGAWLVELSAVHDPALVGPAIGAAIGLQQAPGLPLTESLAAALGREQRLLVLDNCEHVLAAVAALCHALLPAVDDIRVLATSREPLGMAGEARFRLRPLPVPGAGWPAGGWSPGRGDAVRGSRPAGRSAVRPGRRHGPDGGAAGHPAGRDAAGHRAGRGPDRGAGTGAAAGPAGGRHAAADQRRPERGRAPSVAGGDRGLELSAAQRPRATGLPSGSRASPAPSPWTRRRRSRVREPSPWSCTWSIVRCSARPGPARTAGCGT